MEPAADLRERNLGTIFDVILDHDSDGVTTAGDFDQLGADVCEQLGVTDGPRPRRSAPGTGHGGSS